MTQEVAVISWAFTDDPGWWQPLRESAERLSVPLDVQGAGRQYPPFVQGYEEALARVRARSEKYLILTDAYDVFMSRWSKSEVIEAIESANGGLLISTEDWCWPPGAWCDVYVNRKTSPWYAANGGQCCGLRESIASLLEVYVARIASTLGGGNNQQLLHQLLSEGFPMSLDDGCRVFQSFHGNHANLVIEKDGLAFNTVTGSYPMFLHFNGRTPGMRPWYEKLSGKPWRRTGPYPD